MRKARNAFILAAICVSMLPSLTPASSADADGILVYTPPKPLERSLPSYPGSEARLAKEGWVSVEFTVKADGSVADVRVIDSSGGGEYEAATLRAVQSWRYQPAMADGVAIDVTGVRARLPFKIRDGRIEAARPEFVRDMRKLDKALQAGDLAAAQAIIDEHSKEAINLYENAFLSLRAALVHSAAGRSTEALNAIRWASLDRDVLDNDFMQILLTEEIVLETRLGLYGAALKTIDAWQEQLPKAELPASFVKAANDIRALAASSTPMDITTTLAPACAGVPNCRETDGVFAYTPLRPTVTVEPVSGDVHSLSGRCGDDTAFRGPVRSKVTFTLPGEVGDCAFTVRGATGATVRVVESH